MPADRPNLDPLFALSAVGAFALLLGLAWPFFIGELYVSGDLGRFHVPVRWFYANALAEGDAWLWFPYTYGGWYLHGEGQGTLAHPLNWLGYRLLPFHTAFALEFMRSWLLLVTGMFALLRRCRLERGAAAFGALLFTFCSFGFLHFRHLNFIGILSHLPWILLAADVALRSPRARSVAIAHGSIVLLVASQLLHAHPQITWMSLLVLAAFAAKWVVDERRANRAASTSTIARSIGALTVAIILAFVTAGVQLLPMLDGLAASFRAEPGGWFLATFQLSPVEVTQLLAPYLFAARSFGPHVVERGFYAGAVVVPLIVWAGMRRRALGPGWAWVRWCLAIAALAFLLALGETGVLYRVQQALPIVGLFRAPARYVLICHLGLAVAAAIAFGDLARARPTSERPALRSLWPLACVPLASAVVSFVVAVPLQRLGDPVWETGSVSGIVAGPLLCLAATIGVVAAVHRPRIALPLLIVLTVVDLGAYGLGYVHERATVRLETWAELDRPPVIASGTRLEIGHARQTMRRTRLASGYAAMQPTRALPFEPNPRTTDERAVASGLPRRSALRVAAIVEGRDGAVADPLPRVRLVARTRATDDVLSQLWRIDPAEVALVESAIELPPGERGEARLVVDRPGELHIETDASAPRLLAVSERFDAGWRAAADGFECELIRVYGDFMGCVVPAGRHRVELRFEPSSWTRGLWLTAVGLLSTVVFCAWELRR